MRMEDIVNGFIREFGKFRRRTETPIRRPILFIAHSIGGPILQSILVVSHTTPSYSNDLTIAPIKALFFGASENYFKVTESVLSSFTSDSDGNGAGKTSDSTSPLLLDAKFLSEQTRAFNNFIREGYSDVFECQYFLEDSGSEDSRQKPLSDEEIQALPGQRRIQLGKGHGPIIRYPSREDPDYKRIVVCVKATMSRLLE
ncbi:hypothetical protein L218DRAFT_442725 [Marasmius fiardii PR-910]|nr:hypothetical protein L218DRAFT_442725 [Marasmius fiardii PR-910]